MNYTEKDMEDCFTAGVKFARDMMNNPSNTEYIIQIRSAKEIESESNNDDGWIYCPNCGRVYSGE